MCLYKPGAQSWIHEGICTKQKLYNQRATMWFLGSNQTVAGLKFERVILFYLDVFRSNQTVAGLKLLNVVKSFDA
ncbi:hypothetical protein CW696_07900 [ANME-2 cluster archaeon]|nr:MAG: hypothetical protein CW696_07900 [ANME-2 cluster archaeon]